MAVYRAAALGLLLLASCDYSGDFLFGRPVDGLPDIYHITAEDGGPLVPADIETYEDLQAATIYGELAPPQTTDYGGATFEFTGTGGQVCIWVDPEVAWWNQSVSANPSEEGREWTYPDNGFDDGDIELFAGLSVYYTGSPSKIGDFVVAYEDSLHNGVPISLAACPNTVGLIGDPASAGKGMAEYCTLDTSDGEGISYTVLLRTFSTPLDDDRLAFGLIIANGTCEALRTLGGAADPQSDECVIQGEALRPDPLPGAKDGSDYQPYYGYEQAAEHTWPYSIEFEQTFCDSDTRMGRFCNQEADRLEEAGKMCSWEDFDPYDYDPEERCFCGNPDNTPEAGAL